MFFRISFGFFFVSGVGVIVFVFDLFWRRFDFDVLVGLRCFGKCLVLRIGLLFLFSACRNFGGVFRSVFFFGFGRLVVFLGYV